MNIRMPNSILRDLEFCNSEFEISYPEMGQKALRCFHNTDLDVYDIKPKEKEKLSKEGYNFGEKPFCYTTEDFRNIVVWYVNRAIKNHEKNPYKPKLDSYSFETDEQQLLIKVAEDNLKEKIIDLIEGSAICDENYNAIDSLIKEIKEI